MQANPDTDESLTDRKASLPTGSIVLSLHGQTPPPADRVARTTQQPSTKPEGPEGRPSRPALKVVVRGSPAVVLALSQRQQSHESRATSRCGRSCNTALRSASKDRASSSPLRLWTTNEEAGSSQLRLGRVSLRELFRRWLSHEQRVRGSLNGQVPDPRFRHGPAGFRRFSASSYEQSGSRGRASPLPPRGRSARDPATDPAHATPVRHRYAS